METAVSLGVLCNTLLECLQHAVCMLFAKERFGSNLRHAVHTGVYGNAVATYCAVQQIGVPALACALCLLGEMGYVLN